MDSLKNERNSFTPFRNNIIEWILRPSQIHQPQPGESASVMQVKGMIFAGLSKAPGRQNNNDLVYGYLTGLAENLGANWLYLVDEEAIRTAEVGERIIFSSRWRALLLTRSLIGIHRPDYENSVMHAALQRGVNRSNQEKTLYLIMFSIMNILKDTEEKQGISLGHTISFKRPVKRLGQEKPLCLGNWMDDLWEYPDETN